MQILLLVDCEVPSANSAAALIHDLAEALSARGHSTVVASPAPTLRERSCVVRPGGYELLRIRSAPTKDVGMVSRVLGEALLPFRFWRNARPFLVQRPFDLVVSYSPTIFWAPLLRRLRKQHLCRSYLVVRDIFPQWAVDAGVLKKGPAYLILKRVEQRLYEEADVIGVQSPRNLDYFAARSDARDRRVEVLYNWIRPVNVAGNGEWRTRLGLDGKVVFVYGGNMGVAQDMDNVLRLAESMRDAPVHFVLMGRGSESRRLEERVRQTGLANVTLHAPVERQAFLGLVAEADIGLISLDRRLTTHNIPGKLLSYLGCGKPVVASVNAGNDIKQILEDAGAGFVVANGDDEAFRLAARCLTESTPLRRTMGAKGYQLMLAKFSSDSAARQIENAVRPS